MGRIWKDRSIEGGKAAATWMRMVCVVAKAEGPCWSQDNMMDGEVQKDRQEIQGAVLK